MAPQGQHGTTANHRDLRHDLWDTARDCRPARYRRQISGNHRAGLRDRGGRSAHAGLPVVLGSYPITPASDILHEPSKHKNFNVVTRPKTRSAASARCAGCRLRWCIGVTNAIGTGISLKSSWDWVVTELGAGHRRAAGRAVDRSTHQDRAGRLAASARPQWRVTEWRCWRALCRLL